MDCLLTFSHLSAICPAILSAIYLTILILLVICVYQLSLDSQAPSWRPTWKYFHPATGLVGSILCVICMFLISAWWALVVIALTIGLIAYINYKGTGHGGSGLAGLVAQWAMFVLSKLQRNTLEAEVNWRCRACPTVPAVLCVP